MKIIIGHLFHDLLNLYGESGNIIALEKALAQQNIQVEIKCFSLDNLPWNLEDVDVLYIGAGTEQNQLIALNALLNYKEIIQQMILNNKFIFVTGNSIELFGKHINDNNKQISTLNIFDYISTTSKTRFVSECVFNYDEVETKILGFENHQGTISGIDHPLFTVEKGYSSDSKSKYEGIKYNNFYATYLLGPILARNPDLLEKICKDIILSKDNNFKLKTFDFSIERKAHKNFLDKYNKD